MFQLFVIRSLKHRATIRYKKAMKLVIHRLFFLSAEPFFDDSDRGSASRGEKIVFSDKETGTIKTTRTRHHRFELFYASSTGTKGKLLYVLSGPPRKELRNTSVSLYRLQVFWQLAKLPPALDQMSQKQEDQQSGGIRKQQRKRK